MTNSFRGARWWAALASLFLIASACGGGSDAAEPEDDTAAETTTTTAAATTTSAADDTPEDTTDDAGEEPSDDGPAGGSGAAQTPSPGTHNAGPVTVHAELCTIADAEFTGTTANKVMPAVAVSGDQVYLTNVDGQVLRFTADTAAGCALSLDSSWGDAGVLTPTNAQSALSVAGDRVVASGSVFDSEVISASTGARYTCATTGEVILRADGSSGLGFFPGSPIEEITFTDTNCTVEDPAPLATAIPFKDQTLHSGVFLSDGTLVAGGSPSDDRPDDNNVFVAAFNSAGSESWRQGTMTDSFDDQRYGWVHAVAECGNGQICTLDTNFKRLQIMGPDGTWITSADLNALLGLSGSVWWEAAQGDDQGRLWVPVGAKDTEGDGATGFLFLLSFEGL